MIKMKRVLMIMMMVHLLALPSFSQEVTKDMPSYVNNPETMAQWFARDFKYQIRLPKIPQTPQETIESKGGECDDFAALASEILFNMGISNTVLGMTFKNLNYGHVVCAWKAKDGTYNFISNQQVFYSGKKNIEEAVKRFYPNADKIVLNYNRNAQSRYL